MLLVLVIQALMLLMKKSLQKSSLRTFLQFKAAHEGSSAKMDAQDELFMALAHRRHIDRSVWSIGKLLLLKDGGHFSLEDKRPSGQPLVDDWDCLKNMVSILVLYFLREFAKLKRTFCIFLSAVLVS